MKKIKSIFCAIFRHSKIHNTFFGEMYCGRCGAKVGDCLLGIYDGKDTVVTGHKGGECEECLKIYKNLNWIDRFLVPYPFNKSGQE